MESKTGRMSEMDLNRMMEKSIFATDADDEPLGPLDFGDPPKSNKTEFAVPAGWRGTPMEMVSDAFGSKSPWRSSESERRYLKRRKKAISRRKDKAAKAARRKNRR